MTQEQTATAESQTFTIGGQEVTIDNMSSRPHKNPEENFTISGALSDLRTLIINRLGEAEESFYFNNSVGDVGEIMTKADHDEFSTRKPQFIRFDQAVEKLGRLQREFRNPGELEEYLETQKTQRRAKTVVAR